MADPRDAQSRRRGINLIFVICFLGQCGFARSADKCCLCLNDDDTFSRATCDTVSFKPFPPHPPENAPSDKWLGNLKFKGGEVLELHVTDSKIVEINREALRKYTELTTINFTKCNLTRLAEDQFNFHSHENRVKSLFLTEGNLKTIDPHAFRGLTSLEKLSLNWNEIEEIPSQAFDDLRNLKQLRLGGNKISSFDMNLLKNLVSLEYLDLSGNPLMTISSFPALIKLETLDLSNTSLTSLNGATFAKLLRLNDINLRGNRLTSLPDEIFSANSELNRIDLGNNQLTDIGPEVLGELCDLDFLDLRGNQLTTPRAVWFAALAKNNDFPNEPDMKGSYFDGNSWKCSQDDENAVEYMLFLSQLCVGNKARAGLVNYLNINCLNADQNFDSKRCTSSLLDNLSETKRVRLLQRNNCSGGEKEKHLSCPFMSETCAETKFCGSTVVAPPPEPVTHSFRVALVIFGSILVVIMVSLGLAISRGKLRMKKRERNDSDSSMFSSSDSSFEPIDRSDEFGSDGLSSNIRSSVIFISDPTESQNSQSSNGTAQHSNISLLQFSPPESFSFPSSAPANVSYSQVASVAPSSVTTDNPNALVETGLPNPNGNVDDVINRETTIPKTTCQTDPETQPKFTHLVRSKDTERAQNLYGMSQYEPMRAINPTLPDSSQGFSVATVPCNELRPLPETPDENHYTPMSHHSYAVIQETAVAVQIPDDNSSNYGEGNSPYLVPMPGVPELRTPQSGNKFAGRPISQEPLLESASALTRSSPEKGKKKKKKSKKKSKKRGGL